MKYILFLPYIILLSFCQTRSNTVRYQGGDSSKTDTLNYTITRNKILDNYIYTYGRGRVLTGLYFIREDFFKRFSDEISSINMWYCSIPKFLEKKAAQNDSLMSSIETRLHDISEGERQRILDKLKMWLKNNTLLSSILDDNLSEDVSFGQIISQIPETKPLLKSYLKNPKQYWGSLDENQSCRLFYDVNKYLIGIDQKERILFFKKYFKPPKYQYCTRDHGPDI